MDTAPVVWEGSPALRDFDLAPIESLTRHPDNPRVGDVPEIARSLRRFGQTRPVLVDQDGTVIAGNHTLLAAESLGWTHLGVVRKEFASRDEAVAYLLADNRLADLGEYDAAELRLLVADLEAHGRWEGTGYTPDDLAQMRALEALADAPIPELDPVAPVDPSAPPPMRELVLLFDEEQQTAFADHVRVLRGRYGLEGVTETVLRAVRDEALVANQTPADA